MKNTTGLVKVLLVACTIPAIGFGVSYFIINDMNKGLQAEGIEVTALCDALRAGMLGSEVTKDLSAACEQVTNIVLLGKGSVLAAAIGAFIPIMYWFASLYAGESRKRVAAVFPLILRFSIIMIAVSVLLQGAILTYAAYIGESYALGVVHYFFIGVIGLGALIAGLKLVWASFSFGRKLEMNVFGIGLTDSDAPPAFQVC